MIRKCVGCGAIIQCEDINKNGYVPVEKIDDAKYCLRCFKITNYNEKLIVPLDGINEFILEQVNKSKDYVFFLIDFLNINSETISTFKSIKNNKTLVISKLDIIPKSISKNVIINFLKNQYDIDSDIIFLSSKKDLNLGSIENTILRNNSLRAYILGYTNAGKSTLINKLVLKNGLGNNVITTSLIPNTTLDFINIKFDDYEIIDSPGFTLSNTLYEDDEFDLIKNISPKKFLKPITYQTKDISSILIEDKIRLCPGNKNSLTFYVSNDISIDRIFNDNDTLLNEECKLFDIDDNSDIVIKGLGFINIKKRCKLEVYSKYCDLIEVRKSMF